MIYGVDADIHDKDPEVFHQEHIRRLAEVVHILLDAGLILLVTAIELTQNDLELIKTVVDEKTIQVVWVGDRVTTDLTYDLKIPGGDQVDESVTKVKQMMQERGIIFKF